MSFFDCEVVRAVLEEMSELQEEIYANVFKFPTMAKEDQLYHVAILEKLLNKQRVLYTRVSLSDDPEAKEMKKKIIESATQMGLPTNVDMNILFANMNNMVSMMKQQIDKESLT